MNRVPQTSVGCKHIGGGSKYTVIWSETAHKEYPLLETLIWHSWTPEARPPPLRVVL